MSRKNFTEARVLKKEKMKESLTAAQSQGIFAFHVLTQANLEASFMVSPTFSITQGENVKVPPPFISK